MILSFAISDLLYFAVKIIILYMMGIVSLNLINLLIAIYLLTSIINTVTNNKYINYIDTRYLIKYVK